MLPTPNVPWTPVPSFHMDERPANPPEPGAGEPSRRDFLESASFYAMLGGLTAGYGIVGLMGGRYLYPARPREKSWLFAAVEREVAHGSSFVFRTPVGEEVTIVRQGATGSARDFVALSSTCPHLGCQVHWQQPQGRFFCPCHNGTFDAAGVATGGPPGEAGQSLPRYPLKLEGGMLFIEVPTRKLADAGRGADGDSGSRKA